MTAASKTERQLIDSIRKAKTGGESGVGESDGASKAIEAAAPRMSEASVPTESQQPRPRAAAAKGSARKKAQTAPATGSSGYSSARRVWPD
ncbi:hypothetical protein [Thiorhodovibrio frisius]|uniref:Uncharacterized protein n=1 Tax=Thiorhodovibrio frisius TaxID=631362 RepID=H8Z168_9GAMM|nr:hypothetical protein [Thiorhodovibrio frisius]EIC21383.1 hypothetical protein Thi970DRAFT_01590 [Thiorhodovibrio frisius]WPL23969.1 hypothetical protein Thiofri_04178 [Thiorhodovibrio frisius]